MKTAWTILISCLASAVVVGGGTYYFVNHKTTKDKNNLQAQINDLNKQLTDAKDTLTATTPSSITSETTGWKTYSNSVAGYSIKYPTDWTASSTTASLETIKPSMADNYLFNIETIASQSSLNDYIDGIKATASTEVSNGQPGDTFGTQSSTTIGDQPAVKFVNCTKGASAYKYDWYFVKNGSNIFKITVTKEIGQGTVVDASQYIPNAEKMITTFQFADSTVGWKTYTNTDYKYSIKLPSDWTHTEKYGVFNSPGDYNAGQRHLQIQIAENDGGEGGCASNQTLSNYFQNCTMAGSGETSLVTKLAETTFAGVQAIQFKHVANPNDQTNIKPTLGYMLISNSRPYTITYNESGKDLVGLDSTSTWHSDTFQQIFDTFELTK